MGIQNPTLPIKVDEDIQSAYVDLTPKDTVITNFNSSRLLTITGTTTGSDSLATSVCSLTAALSGSNSATYHSTRMILNYRHFEESFSSLQSSVGIFTLKKRLFDTKLLEGSVTATATGAHEGDYYDNASGQMIANNGTSAVGVISYDDALFVISSTQSAMVQSITAFRYKAVVQHTEISVYCKAQPNELNFSLNPSVFNLTSIGYSYIGDPLTSSTSACDFYPDLVSSGVSWSPSISHVGLYDDDNNLLAVAKFTRPIKKPTDIPITVRVQLDV